jgi:hypothetical protein
MDILIDWGERPRFLQSRLKDKISGTSFWLSAQTPPIALGLLRQPGGTATWDTAKVAAIPLTPTRTPLMVRGTIPAGPLQARLDFELEARAGGVTKTVLAFRQLFLLTAESKSLVPTNYSVEDFTLNPTPKGPVRQKGTSPTGRRQFSGQHPLLTNRPGQIAINTEFVDATELWWAIHQDRPWGWYLHPDLGGRQEHLRVLAWTGGGSPMIWFAAIPDAASETLDPAPAKADAKAGDPKVGGSKSAQPVTHQPPADIVFFRPPPGANSIRYMPTAAGFSDPGHDNTTLHILARYLLSAIPANAFARIKQAGTVKQPEFLADQIQPTSTNPTTPANPMDIARGLWTAFRPVGLEGAVNRAGPPHVLFLPLGFDAEAGYEAARQADLKTTLASALNVLWNNGAVANKAQAPPDPAARQLWLAGHSAGNLSMWRCLSNNAASVDRVISFDATPKGANLDVGVTIIQQAVRARKAMGKGLDIFVITSPNMLNKVNPFNLRSTPPIVVPLGMDQATDEQLRRTGAVVTLLPDFAEATYWQIAPAAKMNLYLRYLLTNWRDAELDASAMSPRNWNFLFFHEYAVYGGHLVAAPDPNTQPSLRSFFEDALGPPKPRPPFP